MASVYDLKPRFVALLRPVAATLARLGVTANAVTLAAMIGSIAVGIVLAWWPTCLQLWLILPVFLFLRMAANAIDGILAREHGMKSRLGAILNEVGDVVSDTALTLPVLLLPGVTGFWVIMAIVIAIISELVGVLGQVIGSTRRYDGPMGKSDRALALGLLGLMLGVGLGLGSWIDWEMIIVAALGLVTIFNRARKALAETPK